MLEINVFTMVVLVVLINIILANLFNWAFRKCSEDMVLPLMIVYFILLFLSYWYLYNII